MALVAITVANSSALGVRALAAVAGERGQPMRGFFMAYMVQSGAAREMSEISGDRLAPPDAIGVGSEMDNGGSGLQTTRAAAEDMAEWLYARFPGAFVVVDAEDAGEPYDALASYRGRVDPAGFTSGRYVRPEITVVMDNAADLGAFWEDLQVALAAQLVSARGEDIPCMTLPVVSLRGLRVLKGEHWALGVTGALRPRKEEKGAVLAAYRKLMEGSLETVHWPEGAVSSYMRAFATKQLGHEGSLLYGAIELYLAMREVRDEDGPLKIMAAQVMATPAMEALRERAAQMAEAAQNAAAAQEPQEPQEPQNAAAAQEPEAARARAAEAAEVRATQATQAAQAAQAAEVPVVAQEPQEPEAQGAAVDMPKVEDTAWPTSDDEGA